MKRRATAVAKSKADRTPRSAPNAQGHPTLVELVGKLDAIKQQIVALEGRIRALAEHQSNEAGGVLARLGNETMRSEQRGKRAHPFGPLGYGLSDRIKAIMADGQQRTAKQIAGSLGVGTDPDTTNRLIIAMCRLAETKDLRRVARGLYVMSKGNRHHDENAQAIAWAKAHPEDPRSAKIMELNR